MLDTQDITPLPKLEGEVPPAQYAVGELCDVCEKPLSRYNAFTTCAPCRYRLQMQGVGNFQHRAVVRRGPLGT